MTITPDTSVHSRSHPASPAEVLGSFWRNRELIGQLVRRDVIGRYRGSFMGVFWSFVHPLLMLAVYTIVLGHFLKTRWAGSGNDLEFSLILFSGLILFNFFSECLSRAPQLVLANPNYVKKIVFPLEILPWVAVGSALFHTAVSLLAWGVFYLLIHGLPHWTIVYVPLLLLPLAMISLGCSWLISAAGVYVRDIGQVMSVVVQALMFLSPLFYTVESVAPGFRKVLMANPLTYVIEQARAVMIAGIAPGAFGLLIYWLVSLVVAWLGLVWFQHTRDGFADVM